jgi:hypothetical protein
VTEAAAVTELPDLGDLGDLAELAELASSAADTAGALASQPTQAIDEPALSDATTAGEEPGQGSLAVEGTGAGSPAPGRVSTGERSTPDPDEWLMKGRGSKGGKRWRRRGS